MACNLARGSPARARWPSCEGRPALVDRLRRRRRPSGSRRRAALVRTERPEAHRAPRRFGRERAGRWDAPGLDRRRTEHEATRRPSRCNRLRARHRRRPQGLPQIGLVHERSARPRFHLLDEASERQPIHVLLVPESVGDARPVHPHRLSQVVERRPREPLRPEYAHRGIERPVGVELPRTAAWTFRCFYTSPHRTY